MIPFWQNLTNCFLKRKWKWGHFLFVNFKKNETDSGAVFQAKNVHSALMSMHLKSLPRNSKVTDLNINISVKIIPKFKKWKTKTKKKHSNNSWILNLMLKKWFSLFYIMNHAISLMLVFESEHDKTNQMTCAPSEDPDHTRHPQRLITVFAVMFMGS